MDAPLNNGSASDAEILHEAEELLALTRQMLEAADAKSWEALAELEEKRRLVMAEIFSGTLTEAGGAAAAALIQRILAMDRRILEQGEVALGELAASIAALEQGRKAQRAYGEAG